MQRLLVVLLALFFAYGETVIVPDIAHAQQNPRGERRINLLDMIFGGALRPPSTRRNTDKQRARRVIVQPQAPVTRSEPAKPVVEKVENAATVLIVGDFMASGLEAGLQQSYAANPNVVFVDAGKGLSGLVRDDVVDWPVRIGELIEEHKPVAVIVMVGMNDRQEMRIPTGNVDKLTDAWKAEYVRRVDAVIKSVRERSLPLFWVGLPPVKSTSMNSDYLVFNEIVRNEVKAAGGQFIDIWDAFTGADGGFVSAGPDVNGQIVRLRNSDGINMTSDGKKKMAFYVEKELRRTAGLANDTSVVSVLPDLNGQVMPTEPDYDPAGSGRTIVVSLDGPSLDGGDALEGAPTESAESVAKEAAAATSYDLVVRGLAVTSHKGRIDYEWGAPGIFGDEASKKSN